MQKKFTIGVLMGGRSVEKEVSLNSGRTVCDHLDTARYSVVPLFQTSDNLLYQLPWRFLYRGKISDFEHRLEHEAQRITWDDLKTLVDFIYIAQHGRYAEDGTMQGMLEILKIPYLGSKVFASALGMDKHMQKTFLRAAGVLVPKSILIKPAQLCTLPFDYAQGKLAQDERCGEQVREIEELLKKLETAQISFPLVVKPAQEGSSFGVSMVENYKDLIPAIRAASCVTPYLEQAVMLEEKISGLEFSCIVITDYQTQELIALSPTEIVQENSLHIFDYEQKYMPGRATKFTPARCSKTSTKLIQDACIKTMKALDITNLARIDGFLTPDNNVIIIDPNSFSGMSPSSFTFLQAAQRNMSTTELINHLIETELSSYGLLNSLILEEEKNTKNTLMNSTQKTRVAVLLGGRSHEKEISLESGRNIVYKLSPQKYTAIPLFLTSNLELYKLDQKLLVCHSTKEIESKLTPDLKINWSQLPEIADFVFIGLHGGEGENGTVQGALETLEVPYNGSSVLASALCMDKFKTNLFLKENGFSVPEGILISREEINSLEEKKLPAYPLIVKPHDDGCSVGVQKVHNQQELIEVLTIIFNLPKSHALIEECVTGMELTVGVIGNNTPRALPPSQAVASSGILSIQEKFLPGAGENQTPAPLPQETLTFVQKTIEDVYKTINCKGYARIDCFYQTAQQSPTEKERVVILEINSLPGMTPATCIFHQAAEISIQPMDFIDMIVQFGFEEHQKQLTRTHDTTASINPVV